MRTSIALIIATLIVTACATPSQMSSDAEVTRLCAIDGGVKVYETVRLPAETLDANVRIPFKEYSKPTDEFYYESSTEYLSKESTSLWRGSTKLVRRVDGKVLGESIHYARTGGDLPGPWHPSSYSCPLIGKKTPNLRDSVFIGER